MSAERKISRLAAKAHKTKSIEKRKNSINAISEMLEHNDSNVRLLTIHELKSLYVSHQVADILRRTMKDSDADVCIQSAIILYDKKYLKNAELCEFYVECICSSNDDLVEKAYEQLCENRHSFGSYIKKPTILKMFIHNRTAAAKNMGFLMNSSWFSWHEHIMGVETDYLRMATRGNKDTQRFLIDLGKYCFDKDTVKTGKIKIECDKIIKSITMIRDNDGTEPLIEALESEILQVQTAAVRALGAIGDISAAKPLLIAASSEDNTLTNAVYKAIVKIMGNETEDYLTKNANDPNEKVRMGVYRTVAEANFEKTELLLKKALKDKDIYISCFAAEALGNRKAKSAVYGLLRLLKYEYSAVIIAAEQALGKIGDEKAVDNLSFLLSDSNGEVRKTAAQAISDIGTFDWTKHVKGEQSDFAGCHVLPWELTVPVLSKALKNNSDSQLRANAAAELGFFGDKSDQAALLNALNDNSSIVRKTAADALKNLHCLDAVEPLTKMLGDTDWQVQTSVAEALGVLNDVRAIKPLINTLQYTIPERKVDKHRLYHDRYRAELQKEAENTKKTAVNVRRAAARALLQLAKNNKSSLDFIDDYDGMIKTIRSIHADKSVGKRASYMREVSLNDCHTKTVHEDRGYFAHQDKGIGLPKDELDF